jgi:ElaB/YqjD/DUF883 family membrane-anchored ribosome-binding protein
MAQLQDQLQETARRLNGRNNGAILSKAKHVREDMADIGHDLNRLAARRWKATKRQMEDLREHADDGMRYVGKQVRTRPVTALGVAAGVGILLGAACLGGRRARDR